jgi:hypothetical protein
LKGKNRFNVFETQFPARTFRPPQQPEVERKFCTTRCYRNQARMKTAKEHVTSREHTRHENRILVAELKSREPLDRPEHR